VKLHKIKNSEPQNIEYRISKDGSAVRCLFIIDRMHLFDARCWAFDVRRSSVSFPIRLAAVQSRGRAVRVNPARVV
jgi:hypothetical protein